MEYDITQTEQDRTVTVKGRMSFKEMHAFGELKKSFFSAKSPRYVFDLSEVSHIDSAGLGMLLIAREQARGMKADVALCASTDDIKTVLRSAKFQDLFSCIC
jgi:anti-anti-sigma factor